LVLADVRHLLLLRLLIWGSDEVLYQARLHPEQYSNTFSNEQIKRLHNALMYVCDTAVELLGDSDALPKDCKTPLSAHSQLHPKLD
jgi:formamidopyrimidine-DNA glycosylase